MPCDCLFCFYTFFRMGFLCFCEEEEGRSLTLSLPCTSEPSSKLLTPRHQPLPSSHISFFILKGSHQSKEMVPPSNLHSLPGLPLPASTKRRTASTCIMSSSSWPLSVSVGIITVKEPMSSGLISLKKNNPPSVYYYPSFSH